MNFVQVIGISAGILTSVSMLPQLIKIIKEKEAKDISIVMILILLAGLCMWIYYGILKKDMPIIVTNIFSVVVNLTLLFFRLRYWKKKS